VGPRCQRLTTIPDQLKEIVTFVFVRNVSGQLQPNGTGFFVGVRGETNKERFFIYLVTANHVLLDNHGQYYPEVFVRLNTKSGESELLQIDSDDGHGE